MADRDLVIVNLACRFGRQFLTGASLHVTLSAHLKYAAEIYESHAQVMSTFCVSIDISPPMCRCHRHVQLHVSMFCDFIDISPPMCRCHRHVQLHMSLFCDFIDISGPTCRCHQHVPMDMSMFFSFVDVLELTCRCHRHVPMHMSTFLDFFDISRAAPTAALDRCAP